MSDLPLAGITVLEMATVASGPFAGLLLADLGAEVIKVELPGTGDVFRKWAGDAESISPMFAAYNRAKKSVTINVAVPEGAACYLRLARTVDVVLENFRPGTLDRYGVGYAAISELNPAVVYCAITGMGSSGPERDAPTYDAIAQAMSGLWSQFTDLADPLPVGPPLSDQLAGMYAAQGILAALLVRRTTGSGQRLEVSMLGSSLSFQNLAVAGYLQLGETPDMLTRARRSQSYAFLAADDRPLAVHLSTPDKFWHGLLSVVGRPELAADERFATKTGRIRNYDALRAELAVSFATKPRAEWLSLLRAADVPAASLNTIGEALLEPQVQHLGIVHSYGSGERAMRFVGPPIAFQDGGEPGRDPTPLVGEHTDEVLRRVGINDDELATLRGLGGV